MSGPYTSYNTVPPNFEFQAEKYGNSYGKVAGVGCDGTKYGPDAAAGKYSSPFVGGNGYSFTDKPIGPVAGPNAPYSEIQAYNNTTGKYRDIFPPQFKSSLMGGKKRRRRSTHKRSKRKSMRVRKIQYGCSRKSRGGGRKHRTMRRQKSKRTMYKRKTMRGGMSSASDYTQGRDTSQDQPYGNKAYSFGQGLDSMLSANESALASPPPFLPYNDCGKVMRH